MGDFEGFYGETCELEAKRKVCYCLLYTSDAVMIDWQQQKKQNKRSKNIKGERPIIAGLIEKNLIDKSSLKREK